MNDSSMKSSAPTTPKTTTGRRTRTARRTKPSSAAAAASSLSLSSSVISFLFLIVTMLMMMTLAEGRNAHFTMEFIPTFKNGLPYKCHPNEIKTLETFLGTILKEETGMIEHNVEYLDSMYDPNDSTALEGSGAHHMKRHHFSKVRGFDFTFDCPTQQGGVLSCPDNDWCHVLCLDETVKPGHESLTERANNLKSKLHANSKTVEGPAYNVKCLGQTSDLDLHLLVSVSPGDETSTHEEL